jgi:hypothetical protein
MGGKGADHRRCGLIHFLSRDMALLPGATAMDGEVERNKPTNVFDVYGVNALGLDGHDAILPLASVNFGQKSKDDLLSKPYYAVGFTSQKSKRMVNARR